MFLTEKYKDEIDSTETLLLTVLGDYKSTRLQ